MGSTGPSKARWTPSDALSHTSIARKAGAPRRTTTSQNTAHAQEPAPNPAAPNSQLPNAEAYRVPLRVYIVYSVEYYRVRVRVSLGRAERARTSRGGNSSRKPARVRARMCYRRRLRRGEVGVYYRARATRTLQAVRARSCAWSTRHSEGCRQALLTRTSRRRDHRDGGYARRPPSRRRHGV